ncbi:MAG: hypothetical protein ACMG57_04375 [Candidatus Dojkabacteria bacterium]
MGSDSGKYIIPFGIVILILNVVLILVLMFQDILVPKPVITDTTDVVVSSPSSFPVSF